MPVCLKKWIFCRCCYASVLEVMVGLLLLLLLSTLHGVPVCEWGRYGTHCDLNCSGHCGLYGDRKFPPCDKDTGKCLNGCVRGRHGNFCDQLCSQNCIKTTCNKPDGGCTRGCTDGYTGYFCNVTVSPVQSGTVCDAGQYGPHCDHHCPVHCGLLPETNRHPCHKSTGKCSEGCVPGRYGDLCDQLCSHNCINTMCNQSDGGCILGCTDGYTGYFCNKPTGQRYITQSEHVMWMLPTIIFIMTTICCWRSGRCRRICNRWCGWLIERVSRSHTYDPSQGGSETDELLPRNKPTFPTHATPSQADYNLYFASRDGDLEEVRRILSAGHADINFRGEGSWTPVMAAALEGHGDVVELLVSRGADVSLMDDDGNNILHCACKGGDRETVEFVLTVDGVDINFRGEGSWTPMMAAALEGHGDVVELLVSRGADVSLLGIGGNTTLHLACKGGDRKTVEFVLSGHGVNINSRGWRSWTPVMEAALYGHSDVVELLVGRGADLSLVDKDGENILHLACREGYVKIVEFVLSLNVVDINARTYSGQTAAEVAREWERHQLADLLVSRAQKSL